MPLNIEKAGVEDSGIIARFHVLMFAEMLDNVGKQLNQETRSTMHQNMEKKLLAEMPSGICRVWKGREQHTVVAVGAMTIISSVPSPYDTNSTIGYIHSIYTLPQYRKKGYSTTIMNQILLEAEELGLNRVTLNASTEGERLYRRFGFSRVEEHMRLYLQPQDTRGTP